MTLDKDSIFEEFDLKINVQVMDNKEKRTRIICDDNTVFGRTEQSETSSWQNAHYHNNLLEMYIVQKGYIVLALKKDEEIMYKKLTENQYYNVETMTSHNVYMPSGSVMHTIKYGNVKEEDWNYDEELDKITKNY